MSAWEVVLLELGEAGRTLEPPEVPSSFATAPNPGDIIRGKSDAAWKVMRIEHGESTPKIDHAARATIERLGKGNAQMAAYLAPQPVCRILVRAAQVWSEGSGKHMLLGFHWPDDRHDQPPRRSPHAPGEIVCLNARPQINCRLVSLMVDRSTAENWSLLDIRIGKNSLCGSTAGISLKPFAVERAVLDQMLEVRELHVAEGGAPDTDGARLPDLSDPILSLFDLGVAQCSTHVGLIVQNLGDSPSPFCGGLLVEHAYLGGELW